MNFNQARLFSEFLLSPGAPFSITEKEILPKRDMCENSGEQVEAFAQSWVEAEKRSDTSFLLSSLTEDFVGVGPRGFMLDKNAWLERYTTGVLQHEVFNLDEVKVRMHSDSAIVTGKLTLKSKLQERKIDGIFRISLMVVKEGDEMLLAGLQLSSMAVES